ncbi:MAG: hypothetical protein F9K16_12615 [Thermoanaerobaculia bacterium]|nr:MAG: hypothetical protein F9K16_12615 [Thermoanaerobaculia bacterium]
MRRLRRWVPDRRGVRVEPFRGEILTDRPYGSGQQCANSSDLQGKRASTRQTPELADSLPDAQKTAADQALPTGRSLNSHHPVPPKYRGMLATWNRATDRFHLLAAEFASILAAPPE